MGARVSRADSESERAMARAIRHAVFVLEQAVPAAVEVDGLDDQCEHFLAWLGSEPVATLRTRRTDKGWKVERVAVRREHRGSGVGIELVRSVLLRAPAGASIYVHAQASALGFWQRVGFVAQGPSFEEGGIAHRWMQLSPAAAEPGRDGPARQ